MRTPIRRIRSVCARAAKGQEAAAPANAVIKSRRLIGSPSGRRRTLPHSKGTADVLDGPNAEVRAQAIIAPLPPKAGVTTRLRTHPAQAYVSSQETRSPFGNHGMDFAFYEYEVCFLIPARAGQTRPAKREETHPCRSVLASTCFCAADT